MEVVVNDLTVTVAEKRQLLKQIDWKVLSGEMVALMGPSGAGKTTLLNCLVGRGNIGAVNGSLTFDDLQLEKVRARIGYVTQDDIMYETLTIRENLSFAARLIQRDSTAAERQLAVTTIMEKLGLVKCADTVVGSPGLVKGISGGERKRTNVALSLLGKPSLLLLDEPTSGLDSKMAADLMADIQEIAKQGCTVIATIHQPSEAVFQGFGKVMLLHSGQMAYYGAVVGLRQMMQERDFSCPEGVPLPELLLDALEPPPGKSEEDLQRYLKRLSQLQDMTEKTTCASQQAWSNQASLSVPVKRASFFSQLSILTHRDIVSLRRNKVLTVVRAVQSIASSVLIGWIFWQTKGDKAGVQTRLFSSFLLVFTQFMFALIGVINAFPSERAVFLREAQDKLYHPAAFYISKVVTDTVMQCIFPAFVVAISYPMIGLNSGSADRIFLFYAIMIVVSNCGSAVGFIVSASVSSVSTALAIAPGLVMPQLLLSGIFIKVADLPQPFNAISHVVLARYAVQATITNEFTCETKAECDATWRIGKEDQCNLSPCDFCCSPHDVITTGGICPILSCDDALRTLELDEIWPAGNTNEETIMYNILAMLCLLVFFRIQGLNALMISFRRATGTGCFASGNRSKTPAYTGDNRPGAAIDGPDL